PITVTPRDARWATSASPTAPAAPQTTALAPAGSGQCRTRPAAVIAACASDAPSSNVRLSGSRARRAAGAVTYGAHDPGIAVQHTREAGASGASAVASTTMPAPSMPASYGNGIRIEYAPDRTSDSTWFKPTASTRTRTSPGASGASVSSTIWITSG